MTSRRWIIAATAAIALLAIVAFQSSARANLRNGGEANLEPPPGWDADRLTHELNRFESDVNPEQALYLAAAQMMDVARISGDFAWAERQLLRIATDCPKQSVRTSVRRLLVDHYLAAGDAASARTHLETIVAENLQQF